jgi:hypothetical protein
MEGKYVQVSGRRLPRGRRVCSLWLWSGAPSSIPEQASSGGRRKPTAAPPCPWSRFVFCGQQARRLGATVVAGEEEKPPGASLLPRTDPDPSIPMAMAPCMHSRMSRCFFTFLLRTNPSNPPPYDWLGVCACAVRIQISHSVVPVRTCTRLY